MKNNFRYVLKDATSTVIDQIDFSLQAFGGIDAENPVDLKGNAPIGFGLFIISNGTFRVDRSLSSFIASKNDILLAPPKHQYSITSLDKNSEYFYIFFKINDIEHEREFFELFNLSEIMLFKSTIDDWQINNIYYLNNASIMNHEGIYILIKSALLKLFVVMIKHLRNNQSTFVISTAQNQQEVLLLKIVDYIEKNIKSRLTINSIADHFGYSENYIYKIFTSILNVSCKTYILEYRLALSVEYLLTTNLSMNTIAIECGFTSTYHFSKAFKKKHEYSPLNYRLANRKSNSNSKKA